MVKRGRRQQQKRRRHRLLALQDGVLFYLRLVPVLRDKLGGGFDVARHFFDE